MSRTEFGIDVTKVNQFKFVKYITYSAIFAADLNGGIGINNKLPWDYKEDMVWFKDNTKGKCIIMGSNTFRSLGCKPLPNRLNIVLSSSIKEEDFPQHDNLKLFRSVQSADEWIRRHQSEYPELEQGEVMVIGGAQIYRAYQDKINQVYRTLVCEVHECDTHLHFNSEGWDLRYMNKPSYITPIKFEIWHKKSVFE